MKRILWGVLIILSFILSSHTLFEITLHKHGCYYEGISVISSENGGWLVSGAYNCDGNPAAWKSCLLEIDSAGDTLFVSSDNSYNGIMKKMPDGNLIFAGGNHAGFVYDTAKIFKVNTHGSLKWEKGLFPGYCHHLLTDILPVEDGFLLTGNHAQSSCSSPVYDAYIAKLDTAGELLWKHDVSEAGNDQLHGVKITSNNRIAAFGWSEKKSGVDDADYFLILLDANGNKIWSKTYGDEQDNYGYGMDVLPDGGFALNGHASTMDVMRLDSSGNLLWHKSLTETCGGRYFSAYGMHDGGLLFQGMEKTGNQPCSSVLIKTNSSGEIFWKKNFSGVVRSVDASQTGRYVITGYKSYLPKLFVTAFDTTTLLEEKSKTEIEHFNVQDIFYSTEEQAIETTFEPDATNSPGHHRVFPNPAMNITTLEFTNTEQKSYHLQIFDVQGKRVMNQFSNTERFVVDALKEKGIYNYLLTGAGKTFAGKIVIQ